MKAKKSKVEVSMSPIIVQTMELNISGETPLLMERYSEENEKALLDLGCQVLYSFAAGRQ
jgi:hypothetical protein